MAKSKVDTLALEATENNTVAIDDSAQSFDVRDMALDAVDTLLTAYGTTEYQTENLARQMGQGVEFLLYGRGQFKGKSSQVTEYHTQLIKHEDDMKKDVAGAEQKHAMTSRNLDRAQAEERDLQLLMAVYKDAYQMATGNPYVPLGNKKPEAKILTAAERLAAKKRA